MAIRVDCPKCKQTLEAPDELGGRTAICPRCRTKMQLPAAPPAIVAPVPGPVPISTPLQPEANTGVPRPETKIDPAQSVDRIEFMVSDVRAELRSINRKLGCLIVVFVFAVVAGIVAAVVLIHQAARLVL
jgi:hypothetical protein